LEFRLLCFDTQLNINKELLSQKLLYDNWHVLTLLQVKSETQKVALENYITKSDAVLRSLLHNIDPNINEESASKDKTTATTSEEDKIKLLQHYADSGPITGSFDKVLDLLSAANTQAQKINNNSSSE
jgi:exosome complex RNA-binding protein Rrp42 (RNase PH superfamily)